MDMDGKINVNAHGNQSQINANNNYMTELTTTNPFRNRGRGYGPAEIDLEPLFGTQDEQRIMEGFTSASGQVYVGRYGVDGRAGYDDPSDRRDDWSEYQHFGLPFGSFTPATIDGVPGTLGNHYQSSAMDVWGRFSMGWELQNTGAGGFDYQWVGMPIANVATSTLEIEVQNSPYETSFAPGPFAGARDYDNNGFADDALYTPAELQRVLRPNDPDAFLMPERLEANAATTWGNPLNRMMVTTDSYEVPTIFEARKSWYSNPRTSMSSSSLAEKLYEILSSTNNGNVGVPASPQRNEIIRANIANALLPNTLPPEERYRRELLAPEIRRGRPMDINRPFGDGVDNNGNEVVDEVFVSAGQTESTNESILHPVTNVNHQFDHDFDSVTPNDNDAYLARAVFARQLYMLILLTTQWTDRNGDSKVDTSDWFDFNGDGNDNAEDLVDYRRVVAQWCINVVDFRDPDSICTPFEVDLQPWDGWDVDGDLTTDEGANRHVFWGTERPELVITETMAAHDRRTQNTDLDPEGEFINDPGGGDLGSAGGGDIDFDTHLLPVASAFFELYNPWIQNKADQIFPAEFYATRNNRTGVDLQKLSPADNDSPVWRMIASAGDQRELDPDDPSNNESNDVVAVQREIYFVKPGVTELLNTGMAYYPPTNITVNPLEPGRYAVVGSATAEDGNLYQTWFGRRTNANPNADLLLADTRSITLEPLNNNNNGRVTLRQWDPTTNAMVSEVREGIIALPISRYYDTTNNNDVTRSFGLSDPAPMLWYDNVMTTDTTKMIDIRPSIDPASGLPDGFALYDAADTNADVPLYVDSPADRQIPYANNDFNRFLRFDGLHSGYKTIHLQRLANPLEAYDSITNPYLTVDSNAVDLFTFNGVENDADPLNDMELIERFGSFERRDGGDPTDGTVGLAEPGQVVGTDGRYRMLWKNNLSGKHPTPQQVMDDSPTTVGDQHFLSRNFANSLGLMNDAYVTPPTGGNQNMPFAWLQWNNRPYASALELANVPYTSSYWLPR